MRSTRRLKKTFVGGLLAVIAATLLTFATPASADHGNLFGHWPVGRTVKVCPTTPELDTNIRSAMVQWTNAGFPNIVRHDCSVGIKVYPVNLTIGYGDPGAANDGLAVMTYDRPPGPTAHMVRCRITVRRLTGAHLSQVVLHEAGHCVGLVHTLDSNSIMGPGSVITQHDRDALTATYAPHPH